MPDSRTWPVVFSRVDDGESPALNALADASLGALRSVPYDALASARVWAPRLPLPGTAGPSSCGSRWPPWRPSASRSPAPGSLTSMPGQSWPRPACRRLTAPGVSSPPRGQEFASRRPRRPDGWTLDGTKPWCSLAGSLTHALVTAWLDDHTRGLFAIELSDPGVRLTRDGWHARGLRDIVSRPAQSVSASRPPRSANRAGTTSAAASPGAGSASPPSGTAEPSASLDGCSPRPRNAPRTRSPCCTSARSTSPSPRARLCLSDAARQVDSRSRGRRRRRPAGGARAARGRRLCRDGAVAHRPRARARPLSHSRPSMPNASPTCASTSASTTPSVTPSPWAVSSSPRRRRPVCRGDHQLHPRRLGDGLQRPGDRHPGWSDAPPLSLRSGDHDCTRLVVVAAHPDDESLGAGGLIATAHDAGIPIYVVLLTAGEASHPESPSRSRHDLATQRLTEAKAGARDPRPGCSPGLPRRRRRSRHRGAVGGHHQPGRADRRRSTHPARRPLARGRPSRPRGGRARGGGCRAAYRRPTRAVPHLAVAPRRPRHRAVGIVHAARAERRRPGAQASRRGSARLAGPAPLGRSGGRGAALAHRARPLHRPAARTLRAGGGRRRRPRRAAPQHSRTPGAPTSAGTNSANGP